MKAESSAPALRYEPSQATKRGCHVYTRNVPDTAPGRENPHRPIAGHPRKEVAGPAARRRPEDALLLQIAEPWLPVHPQWEPADLGSVLVTPAKGAPVRPTKDHPTDLPEHFPSPVLAAGHPQATGRAGVPPNR